MTGSPHPPGSPTRTPPGARVLLAEDDSEFRRLLTGALRREGYDVTDVATGSALLDAMQAVVRGAEAMPALVLTDQRMPGGVRGLNALRCARDLGWTLPLVLITAYEDEDILLEASRAGVVVVRKPFDIDDVCMMVRFLTSTEGTGPRAG